VTEAAPTGAVWDGVASTWHAAGDLLAAPPGDLRLAAAWRCEMIDGFADAAGAGYVCVHTLGLAKFGRPDLVAFGTAANRGVLEALVAGLGEDLVAGAVLRAGDVVDKGGLRVRIEGYVPDGHAPALDVPFLAMPLVLVPADEP
jgi:hypothetical protein